jgi:diaminohydroxyphosphoribosylaminopyrimidine deaminase/5-amino-6-(5-phosphoribosylamino)uracil reductase
VRATGRRPSNARKTMTAPERFMRLAVALASAGSDQIGDQAAVGAVVVKDGRVVGMGARLAAHGPSAETAALQAAGPLARGATVFVTVAPLVEEARELMAHGVAAVVAASLDPGREERLRAVQWLRERGVAVDLGVLEDEALALNEVARTTARTGRPFVTLTASVTWDGKIATRSYDSRWISSQAALRDVHELRSRHAAILVGARTARTDDPELTARVPYGRHPVRVICDTSLTTVPDDARVLTDGKAPTWVFTGRHHDPARRAALVARGIRVTVTSGARRVDLVDMLHSLKEDGLASLLVEGGGEMHAAFVEARLADKIVLYVAPKLVGGRAAPTFLEGEGLSRMQDAVRLERVTVESVGPDLKLTGYPVYPES